jgi:hypothetical protein
MPIYLKGKPVVPYFGDYKPLNIYQGHAKIAGWHNEERTGDTAVEWEDTYNDRVGGYVHGQSELQAEYYASEGDSEQIQTVQGKNLLSLYSDNISTSAGILSQTTGTSQPIYKNYDIIYGATRSGYINTGHVTNVSIEVESNTVTFQTSSPGYGIGVKIKNLTPKTHP